MTVRRQRLILAVAVVATAGLAPLVGFAVRGTDGLLVGLAATQIVLVAVVLRIWMSLDGSLIETRNRLRREVRGIRKLVERGTPRGIDKLDLRAFERSSREFVKQVKAERETTTSRLLDHERQIWQLHRETLRQIERGFEVQGKADRNHREAIIEVLTGELRHEYAQVEALLALYHDLDPAVGFPATRSWVASPDLLRHLYERVRHERPGLILECGSGLSTVVMAYALRDAGHDGKLVALEHLPEFADRTVRMLHDHGVADYAEVRPAPLADVALEGETWPWYDLEQLPEGVIDLVFVDGPPGATRPKARFPAMPLLRGQLRKGAVVVMDDYTRPEEGSVVEQWLRRDSTLELTRLRHEKGTAVLRVTSDEAVPAGDDGSQAAE